MAKQFNYEVKTTIRLNMHNPDHVLINNVIQNLDPKIFKSKNQFILDACKFYIDNYGRETFIAKKKDNERAEYIRSADIEDIKTEVIEAAINEARKEVIRLLGGVISGMNVGQPVIMQAANSEAQEPAEDVMDDADVAGDKVATIVTNDKGIARIDDLPLGKYYLVETKTIDGFVLDDTPIEADLSYIDQNTKVVFAGMDVTNERQKVQITVTKTDSETKEALEGAVFGLFAKEDIVNKDGKVIVKADTQIERTVTGNS